MAYSVGLIVALAVFWLGLSGHYTPLMLSLGAFALAFTLWFVARLKIIDRETSPYFMLPRLLMYWWWLMGEIIKANLVVLRAAIRAEPDIAPAIVKVKTPLQVRSCARCFCQFHNIDPRHRNGGRRWR